ncbi:histone-like nucleoid-structuring protein Lsr2 [Arthrobacter woluwensis]|uniref:histone-like nucleoid-structuring protein Lsr2 n=1 Tax=Arthrobacter woluwensis TaxID=156980 RepID=UPI00380BBD5A
MARHVQIQMVDDLDGTPAEETITFSLDGTSYEIDLNKEHAQDLRKTLEPYIAPARRATTSRRGASKPSSARRGDTAEIREWAQKNGYKVSDRGRIHAEVVEAYDKAQTAA